MRVCSWASWPGSHYLGSQPGGHAVDLEASPQPRVPTGPASSPSRAWVWGDPALAPSCLGRCPHAYPFERVSRPEPAPRSQPATSPGLLSTPNPSPSFL